MVTIEVESPGLILSIFPCEKHDGSQSIEILLMVVLMLLIAPLYNYNL